MGARPEDYARAAPFHSYIHVDDFDGPKELAAYLHKLDQDDDLYQQYFQWKVRYFGHFTTELVPIKKNKKNPLFLTYPVQFFFRRPEMEASASFSAFPFPSAIKRFLR